MSSNLWSLYKNYRCPEEKVIKDLTITNSLGLSCNTIDDVSGINFCDGTYIGHGSSFDISTSEILKINTDTIVVDTNQNVGIGRDPVTGKKLAVLGDTLVTGNINTENIDINGVEVIDTTRNIHTNKIQGLTYPKTNIEILDNVIQFDTSYGYLQLNTTNEDWLHLLTNLPRIYVNQDFVINSNLYMYGGSAFNDAVVIDNNRNIITRSIKFDDTSNNIILFSGSNTITQDASNAFYVKPIRNTTTTTYPLLVYNTSNNEILYSNDYNTGSGFDGTLESDLNISCNNIKDVSGIYFCDGTYIGHGSSFDITTDEILEISSNRFNVYTGSNINAFNIDSTGNIGIGFPPSSQKFHKMNINGNIVCNSIYPSNPDTYDIGSISSTWNNFYVNFIKTSTLSSSNTNGALYLQGNLIFNDTSKNIVLLNTENQNNLIQDASNAFYVKPMRPDAANAISNLVYNSGTGEISYQSSSIKYKKNVIDLTEDTSVLTNLQGREYDTIRDNIHSVGYIAEEANEASTNFTWKNPDGTPEGIAWNNILVYAVEEIKKLRNEVDSLKQQIATLSQ